MSQHISPYYFKWDDSYPETLLDPADKCPIENNMITAPPSLLLMMQPLASWKYRDIVFFWAMVQYVFFLLTFIGFYYRFRSDHARINISIAGIVLLFSAQWIQSVFKGQTHFIFPAILSITIALITAAKGYRILIAGILLAVLVWIRPNALLVLPFLFLTNSPGRKTLFYGFVTGGTFFLLLTFLLNHGHYWRDFLRSCNDWLSYFISQQDIQPCRHYAIVEGVHVQATGTLPFHWKSEVTNVFNTLRRITGIQVNQLLVNITLGFLYMMVLYKWFRAKAVDFEDAIMSGVFCYWLYEICNPIPKMSYYYVELFIVVYYMAAKFNESSKFVKLLLMLSAVWLFLDFLPVNLSTSEMLLMASLILFLINKSRRNRQQFQSDLL
ncbi:MAG: DUF2029 domain-containing protein [Pedobacter sp.]|nr:MAG: DUF2029 domain-containing protein [Pedobacter sp.]